MRTGIVAVSVAAFATGIRGWVRTAGRHIRGALIAFSAFSGTAVGCAYVYGQVPQQTDRQDFPQRELVIGTKQAPPFAMKDADGNWSGISIELWREVAQKLGLQFRLAEEPDVQKLIEATSRGDYDVSVAAITITAGRSADG